MFNFFFNTIVFKRIIGVLYFFFGKFSRILGTAFSMLMRLKLYISNALVFKKGDLYGKLVFSHKTNLKLLSLSYITFIFCFNTIITTFQGLILFYLFFVIYGITYFYLKDKTIIFQNSTENLNVFQRFLRDKKIVDQHLFSEFYAFYVLERVVITFCCITKTFFPENIIFDITILWFLMSNICLAGVRFWIIGLGNPSSAWKLGQLFATSIGAGASGVASLLFCMDVSLGGKVYGPFHNEITGKIQDRALGYRAFDRSTLLRSYNFKERYGFVPVNPKTNETSHELMNEVQANW